MIDSSATITYFNKHDASHDDANTKNSFLKGRTLGRSAEKCFASPIYECLLATHDEAFPSTVKSFIDWDISVRDMGHPICL